MERALLEVEHSNELKSMQAEEAKLKHLQQEHQLRLEAFGMHTSQIRGEIEMLEMTIKNIENEILILDTNLPPPKHNHGLSRGVKERALDDARHMHEDLEFQLMEIEAKYETELEEIQNRLIREQDALLHAFGRRQASLDEYDQKQTEMLLRVKAVTELLESERLKFLAEFKRQRESLAHVEAKISQLAASIELQSNLTDKLNETPSPASSSASLSSNSNSTTETTSSPPPPSSTGQACSAASKAKVQFVTQTVNICTYKYI